MPDMFLRCRKIRISGTKKTCRYGFVDITFLIKLISDRTKLSMFHKSSNRLDSKPLVPRYRHSGKTVKDLHGNDLRRIFG
jgi:hypothetical protein